VGSLRGIMHTARDDQCYGRCTSSVDRIPCTQSLYAVFLAWRDFRRSPWRSSFPGWLSLLP
jgi:hypothetical protein